MKINYRKNKTWDTIVVELRADECNGGILKIEIEERLEKLYTDPTYPQFKPEEIDILSIDKIYQKDSNIGFLVSYAINPE